MSTRAALLIPILLTLACTGSSAAGEELSEGLLQSWETTWDRVINNAMAGISGGGSNATSLYLRDARLYLSDSGVRASDRSSVVWSLVDGQLVEPGVAFPLEGGERISVGAYELRYISEQRARRPTGDTIDDIELLPPPQPRSPRATVIAAVTLLVCVAALASVVLARVL